MVEIPLLGMKILGVLNDFRVLFIWTKRKGSMKVNKNVACVTDELPNI